MRHSIAQNPGRKIVIIEQIEEIRYLSRYTESTDRAAIRNAIAATKLTASTGQISFNELGEVQKAVQVQVVRDGDWHRHSIIDDAVLLAPPTM